MRGRNVIAALLVILFSVALAVGITFIVASGNSLDLNIQTPGQTEQVLNTAAIGQPLRSNDTPTPLPTENCTFPIDVWVQYPSAWKIDTYRIGDRTYTKKEMLDILRGNSSDVRGRLLTQIFVVVLNQRNGADATNIRSAFSEAIDWLVAFPPGGTPSDGDLQKANSIYSTLTKFNEGSLGPQTCQFDLAPAVPDQQSSGPGLFTPTGTLTVTSTRIYRYYPSETPQPREPDPKRPRVRPTSVPPTSVPPTAVPPTPTSDLPTAVPTQSVPTIPPATDVPPTPVPPTAAVTRPPATSVPPTPVPPTPVPPTSPPPTSPPATVRPTDPPILPTAVLPTKTPKPPKKTPKPFRILQDISVYAVNHAL